jgi:hypothetical protein
MKIAFCKRGEIMLASFLKEDCCIVGCDALQSGTGVAEYPAADVIRFPYRDRGITVRKLHRRNLGGGEKWANAPPIFFLPKNSFFWPSSRRQTNKSNWNESGERGCIHIKNWFKSKFSTFVT